MNPTQAIIDLTIIAAKLVAQGVKAIMDARDLSAEQKKEAIKRIMAEQDQDTKDLDAMPLPGQGVPFEP